MGFIKITLLDQKGPPSAGAFLQLWNFAIYVVIRPQDQMRTEASLWATLSKSGQVCSSKFRNWQVVEETIKTIENSTYWERLISHLLPLKKCFSWEDAISPPSFNTFQAKCCREPPPTPFRPKPLMLLIRNALLPGPGTTNRVEGGDGHRAVPFIFVF